MTICFLERAGCAGGGKGILCSEEKTFTLSTVDNMRVCMQEVWSVDPIASNSMKSNNPNSGFHKSKVIKTLDTSVPDPSKNQGGHIVMETMEEKISVIEMGALVRGQGNRILDDNCPTLRAEMGDNQPCVLMDQGGGVMNVEYGKTGTLRRETHGHEPIIHHNTVVRRLTPVECERLQGFPDNYTNIPWGKKDTAPDSRRYKALGNSMAVPVMHWIGKRMMDAKEVVCDEAAIDRILYVTPSDDGQLSLF